MEGAKKEAAKANDANIAPMMVTARNPNLFANPDTKGPTIK
jgi:hypothetical protein